MLAFKTTAEMFDAGYAVPLYNIMVGGHTDWAYREERFKTKREPPMVRNSEPDIPLARIEDVRDAAK